MQTEIIDRNGRKFCLLDEPDKDNPDYKFWKTDDPNDPDFRTYGYILKYVNCYVPEKYYKNVSFGSRGIKKYELDELLNSYCDNKNVLKEVIKLKNYGYGSDGRTIVEEGSPLSEYQLYHSSFTLSQIEQICKERSDDYFKDKNDKETDEMVDEKNS